MQKNKKEGREMTPKQRAFCDYFLACGNATEAAEKAGYSVKTAYSIGAENLRKPEIQQFIEAHSKPKEENRVATAQEVLEFYSSVMRDREEMTKNRLRAAENLAKRFGVDKEKVQGDEGALDKLVDAIRGISKP